MKAKNEEALKTIVAETIFNWEAREGVVVASANQLAHFISQRLIEKGLVEIEETHDGATFDSALDHFVEMLRSREIERAKLDGSRPATFDYSEEGRKYVRITRATSGSSRYAFCFVERATGNILKAASWKKPAKHARGTIYAKTFGEYGVSEYGANYMR